MAISSIADLLALILLVPYSPSFHGHTEQRHPFTMHTCSSVPGRGLFSKGEDFQAVVASLLWNSFSQLWKCHLFCFKQTIKELQTCCLQDTLASSPLLFSNSTSQGPDTAHHGLAFSLPLPLLLADEKCNSPSLVTSGDPAPGPTSDFSLESEPFEERSFVDNVLIIVPVLYTLLHRSATHLGQCLGLDTQTLS